MILNFSKGDFEDILKECCYRWKIGEYDLLRGPKTKDRAMARAILSAICTIEFGMSQYTVADLMGMERTTIRYHKGEHWGRYSYDVIDGKKKYIDKDYFDNYNYILENLKNG